MDKGKKSTLEELMKNDETEAILADDKADKISLDEPKRHLLLKTFVVILLLGLIGAGGYVAYQSYLADQELKAEDKVDNTVTDEETNTDTDTETNTDVQENTVYVNATEGLNLRASASSGAAVLTVMVFGDELTVLGESGDWYQVQYGDETGWCAKEYVSEANPLVYTNEDYGFQVTFQASWAGYEFFLTDANPDATAGFYIALPTTDDDYITESDVDEGYASMFALTVWTKTEWTAYESSEEQSQSLVAQNDQYVISASLPNGVAPSDLESQRDEASEIINTVQFN